MLHPPHVKAINLTFLKLICCLSWQHPINEPEHLDNQNQNFIWGGFEGRFWPDNGCAWRANIWPRLKCKSSFRTDDYLFDVIILFTIKGFKGFFIITKIRSKLKFIHQNFPAIFLNKNFVLQTVAFITAENFQNWLVIFFFSVLSNFFLLNFEFVSLIE